MNDSNPEIEDEKEDTTGIVQIEQSEMQKQIEATKERQRKISQKLQAVRAGVRSKTEYRYINRRSR